MTLPIRWAVVRELSTDSPAIQAMLPHDGQILQSVTVVPKNWTPAVVKIVLAAMTADLVNAVEGAS